MTTSTPDRLFDLKTIFTESDFVDTVKDNVAHTTRSERRQDVNKIVNGMSKLVRDTTSPRVLSLLIAVGVSTIAAITIPPAIATVQHLRDRSHSKTWFQRLAALFE